MSDKINMFYITSFESQGFKLQFNNGEISVVGETTKIESIDGSFVEKMNTQGLSIQLESCGHVDVIAIYQAMKEKKRIVVTQGLTMPNELYQPGALRTITDKQGRQFLATPDGVKVPVQAKTVFTQGLPIEYLGTCDVQCEVLINKEGRVKMDNAIEIESPTSFRLNGVVYDVESIVEIETAQDEAARAMITCKAYPDPTQ